jgi:hypothetical protein
MKTNTKKPPSSADFLEAIARFESARQQCRDHDAGLTVPVLEEPDDETNRVVKLASDAYEEIEQMATSLIGSERGGVLLEDGTAIVLVSQETAGMDDGWDYIQVFRPSVVVRLSRAMAPSNN